MVAVDSVDTSFRNINITVREFDPSRDSSSVEDVERRCDVGPSGEVSLFTDLLGDPICRVRNSPAFLMLVAELGEQKEIVGMVRGCIKTVACGKKHSRNSKNVTLSSSRNINDVNDNNNDGNDDNIIIKPVPIYTKVAYILGLRVSPSHRRMGIGLKLVKRMEEWFAQNGAEYSYMATDNDNQASVNLFTGKCGYTKFRTPSILVNPVFAHRLKISKHVIIIRLSPCDAENLYRRRFSTVEFFPRDIDSVLNNPLSLGTFLAVPRGTLSTGYTWQGSDIFLADTPESWAVMSVWNSNDVFKLELRGASRVKRTFARTTRMVDKALPWLSIPSVPELFRPFGAHFLYGIGGDGPCAVKFLKALCNHAHNLAKESGCGVVATEVSSREPLKEGIPHWKRLSCAEDLWCIKRLGEDYSDGSVGDWTKSPPGMSIFVDPREI